MNTNYQVNKKTTIQFQGTLQELQQNLQKFLQDGKMMNDVADPDKVLSEEHSVTFDLTLSVRISDHKNDEILLQEFLPFPKFSCNKKRVFSNRPLSMKDLY